MLKTLAKLFRLKPYDNHLIDGMGEIWLVLAALNILAIAVCDAIAWAYFGYTTAFGYAAWIAAALAGLIVFTLVGSLDAMFVMHDRSDRRADESAVEGAGRRFRIKRDHLALGARIVLVILTFTVTAPFLTQLFFARDITAAIQRSNEATIANKRQEIATRIDTQTAALRTRLAERQRDLELEIAGSGSSGRYGQGPTATAIANEIAALEREIASSTVSKTEELRAFDAAAATPAVLAERYGIDLVREGPGTRARVIAELEQSPAFRSTQLAIKAFLLFMFLGLVCLKLFQPESVRIYYSAQLQAAYARLRAGVFDHRVDPREKAMTPLRFADWYEKDQHIHEVTDRLRDQTASVVERLHAQEEAVRVLHETLRVDMLRMQEALASSAQNTEELERQVAEAQHRLDMITVKITEEQQALDDFRYDETADLSLRDQQMLISTRNRTIKHLGDHRAEAAALRASLVRMNTRLEANRTAEAALRDSLTTTGSEVGALTQALHHARRKRVAEILELHE